MPDVGLHIDRPRLTGSETVYLHLRDGIAAGRYSPGHHFAETALAAELGVSRTPVREALNRLKSDGLVTTARGGVRVITLNPADVQAVYEVRAALERLVAALAAERQRDGLLPPAEVAGLNDHAEEFRTAVDGDDIAAAVGANLRFHELIASLSGNRVAAEFLSRVWARMAISSTSNLVPHTEWSSLAADDHFALAEAISAGDAHNADRLAFEHVTAAQTTYAQSHREP